VNLQPMDYCLLVAVLVLVWIAEKLGMRMEDE
jgi:hypothetical protein